MPNDSTGHLTKATHARWATDPRVSNAVRKGEIVVSCADPGCGRIGGGQLRALKLHITRSHLKPGHTADDQKPLFHAKCNKAGCPGKGSDVSDKLSKHVRLHLAQAKQARSRARGQSMNNACPERGGPSGQTFESRVRSGTASTSEYVYREQRGRRRWKVDIPSQRILPRAIDLSFDGGGRTNLLARRRPRRRHV